MPKFVIILETLSSVCHNKNASTNKITVIYYPLKGETSISEFSFERDFFFSNCLPLNVKRNKITKLLSLLLIAKYFFPERENASLDAK